MQADLASSVPAIDVQILGINGAGSEAGNEENCRGRSIPWLQDTVEDGVWGEWEIAYRDVVVLDAENRVAAVYNLTTHNLAESAKYDELRGLILAAGGP